jgi:hypothetical protein
MTDFLAKSPTLDSNWRAVVLFGRNVASYKLALAKTLLTMAARPDDRVSLEDLAVPFAKQICEHLSQVDKQTTSRSSQFLDACRAFNKGGLAEDKLLDTTVKRGFNNVIDALHVVGSGPVPVRFFVDERAGGGPPAIPRAGVAVEVDLAQQLLFVERIRRVNLTGVRPALNGYQKGRCFYCNDTILLANVDVDHFFPWILKERGAMPDADGIWNLVLACKRCNRGNGGKFYGVPVATLIEKLHRRNNWLVDSHHPLRETIMLQTGQTTEARALFLGARQRIALDLLIHQWAAVEVATDG